MSKPPRRPNPQAGEVWWIQATERRALLTVEVIESTEKTVLLMQVADGAARPAANSPAVRYKKSEFQWVERVPA